MLSFFRHIKFYCEYLHSLQVCCLPTNAYLKTKFGVMLTAFQNTKSSLIWGRQPLSWSCMEGCFFTIRYVNTIDPILLRFQNAWICRYSFYFTPAIPFSFCCATELNHSLFDSEGIWISALKDDTSPSSL